jgi:phosphatidate cytidylyltransferase
MFDTSLTLAQAFDLDNQTIVLLVVVMVLLSGAFVAGKLLARKPESTVNPAVVQIFDQRVRAWLLMWSILVLGFFLGPIATLVLFFGVSFWALREFITLTPTRFGDHRALFWVFFIFTPVQYVLVGLDLSFNPGPVAGPNFYYGLYTILIPVYGSLFVPARVAMSGDYKRFLERIAKIQAGMMICVYSLSHAPALLTLHLETASGTPWEGSNVSLLFYFVLITQLGDVFQFTFDRLLGRRVMAPSINASRTLEGFLGGATSTMLVGIALYWASPFGILWSAVMSLAIYVMGFAGGMTMSAIKRDRGVKDYGTLVQGHAGVLDRIDSLCFAAPIFFHLTRYFFSTIV